MIAEYDQAGTLKNNFLYAHGKPIARFTDQSATNIGYVVSDHLGSLRSFSQKGASLPGSKWRAVDYQPFGAILKEQAAGNVVDNYLYTGKEWTSQDGINLTYFGARWYDATVGRFLQTDPAGEGTNAYSLALNNPITNVDPWGLLSFNAWYAYQSMGGWNSVQWRKLHPEGRLHCRLTYAEWLGTEGIFGMRDLQPGSGVTVVMADGSEWDLADYEILLKNTVSDRRIRRHSSGSTGVNVGYLFVDFSPGDRIRATYPQDQAEFLSSLGEVPPEFLDLVFMGDGQFATSLPLALDARGVLMSGPMVITPDIIGSSFFVEAARPFPAPGSEYVRDAYQFTNILTWKDSGMGRAGLAWFRMNDQELLDAVRADHDLNDLIRYLEYMQPSEPSTWRMPPRWGDR